MKIYTKAGDAGETFVGGRDKVAKDHDFVHAVGVLDELNAHLGLVLAYPFSLQQKIVEFVLLIQGDIFEIGSEVTTRESRHVRYSPRVGMMESEIDRVQAELPLLRNFILPGGTLPAAHLHVARTVCRRAERTCVGLVAQGALSKEAVVYLNRLSDLLFCWSRYLNDKGRQDVIWKSDAM